MRRVNYLIWSTTAVAAALGTSSAAAAENQPAAPPNPGATAQQNPATPAQNADAPTNAAAQGGSDQNAIVVTGQRRALQSARNVKRNSPQIVDAIVAADIGKLPDIAVSDTAARIPGVQVTRERGEANLVLLRGLDRDFYTTTYNSREIFTAETRSVALQDFPSGAIAALEAFKTSTADLIEPGIAGLVNVRSRRPFDFKGFEINGSFWELHPRQAGGWYPNGNIMITDRWRAGDGEIGALLNFSYTDLRYLDSVAANAYFVAPGLGPLPDRTPDWPFVEYDSARRIRPSLNGAIQWRPNPDLEFYVEGLWQGFRHEISDRHFEQPIWGGQSYTNIQLRDGTNLVDSGTVFNPFRGQGWQGGTHNSTNTYQFAGGGSWDHGPLRVTADLAHTNSTFTGHTESIDWVLCHGNFNCGQTVDFVIGEPGQTPTFNIENFDYKNPANYFYRGFFEENQQAKGKDWQGRLDFEYRTGASFLPKLQWGVRYVDRDASRVYGNRYSTMNYGTPIAQVPLDYELFRAGFRGADVQPGPLTWPTPTYQSIQNNLEALRAFAGYPAGPPPYDPLASFKANEKSLAGYAQLNYQFGIVDGQLGARLVHVNRHISGTESTPAGMQPLDATNSETYLLPNINARIRFTPELLLRLAATKTRTRPQFGDLNPSRTVGEPPSPNCVPTQTLCAIFEGGGNPNLKDLKSTNYDASLEYYFSQTGFAAIAAFDHELKGFVTPSSVTVPGNPFPTVINAPINSGKGHVRGFEAQINTFFDFAGTPEWVHWFGIQANATRINASAKYPREVLETTSNGTPILGSLTSDPTDQISRPLLNVSKWSYNVIGIFERGPVSVRLAYNKRSDYWSNILGHSGWDAAADFSSGGNPYVLRQRFHSPGRLDLSASYTFFDRFTLFGDWTNILSQPDKIDLVRMDPTGARFDPTTSAVVKFPYATRYTERIISLGVRFRFGGGEPRAVPLAPAFVAPPPPPVVQPAPPPPPPAPPAPPPPAAPERGS